MSIFPNSIHSLTVERLVGDRRTRYLREAEAHRKVTGSSRTRRS